MTSGVHVCIHGTGIIILVSCNGGCGPRDVAGVADPGSGRGEGHSASGSGAAVYAAAHGRQCGQVL